MSSFSFVLRVCLATLLVCAIASADEDAPKKANAKGVEFFEMQIAPILNPNHKRGTPAHVVSDPSLTRRVTRSLRPSVRSESTQREFQAS
jgi:hypothetical protein